MQILRERRHREAGHRRLDDRKLVLENVILRRLLRFGAAIVPYLTWLAPFIERAIMPRRDSIAPALQALRADLRTDLRADLRHHMAALPAAQIDVTPAIEEQQRRLEKLEEQAAELNHTITNLSEEQLDLADQIRSMAGWVRNTAMAGLFLLALMLILKLVQTIHGMGH